MDSSDTKHDKSGTDEAAIRRAFVNEVTRLKALLREREDWNDKAREAVARLARGYIDGRNDLPLDLPLDRDEELVHVVELLAYRDELRRDIFGAARWARLARLDLSRCEERPLSPLEPGAELCERLIFSETYYSKGNPDLAPGTDFLRHYLNRGWREGRSPHALFDGDWYFANHPEAAASDMSPLTHYVRHGAAAGLQPHPCFDRIYYTERYPDSLKGMPDAFQHFLRRGLHAGNAPSRRVEMLARGRSVVDVLSFLLDLNLHEAGDLTDSKVWPAPLNDYWLPQRLRDYIGDEFGQGSMDFFSYLFSVIAAFGGRTDDFSASRECMFLTRRARSFRHHSRQSRPNVSIVIPVYNNLVYTMTSIISILEHDTSQSFEIIVGDDGSTDETTQTLERLGRSIVTVRHPTNLGFLRNCNACALRAEGRYLVFLNNDTIVLPGWLDELIAPLEAGKNIGLTGSKLLNGDGTLQEAGGILWNDGSAWNYGRDADPRLPQFNYSKEVDYCSGASIAIAKTLWDELGGFDLAFLPAYCEDSDIAFRVRAAGCVTWLAASSMLVHHEGRSHGCDVTVGVKAHQVANQAKLRDRWYETLATEHHSNAQNLFFARDRSAQKPHILVIDHYIPQWDCDAGSRTMFQFIKMFVEKGFHVTLWPDNLYRDRLYAKPLQDAGVEIIYGPQFVGGFERWYSQVAGFVPYVFLSRPQIAEQYINLIDRTKSKVIFYGHDLHWKRLERQWILTQSDELRCEMETMRRLEERICRDSDIVLYPNKEEVEILRTEIPGIVATNVPAWYFEPAEIEAIRARVARPSTRDPAHIMFVGGFQHQPNIDGILWFVDLIWPAVKAARGDAKLTIAGSKPPESIRSLANDTQSIKVAGHISDAALERLYARATVAIIPLRFGGGVKGKVIEAFSKGLPVVSTTVGVQGMPNDLCFVDDDPKEFAAHILSCFNDPAAACSKVLSAIDFIASSYSFDALVYSLSGFIPELDFY